VRVKKKQNKYKEDLFESLNAKSLDSATSQLLKRVEEVVMIRRIRSKNKISKFIYAMQQLNFFFEAREDKLNVESCYMQNSYSL
jgi:hypothetical protein